MLSKTSIIGPLLFLVGLALALIISECALRFLFPHDEAWTDLRRSEFFHYDEDLGWFLEPLQNGTFSASQKIDVKSNTLGFRDREHGPKSKPRLLVLGDSFVWGFDVNQEERFTDLLQQERSDIEIINAGVSGYGTDQEYLLLKKYFSTINPDSVLLVFSPRNDYKDNSSNIAHGIYYKPYFKLVDASIVLQGVPVPRSVATHAAPWSNLRSVRVFEVGIRLWYGFKRKKLPDPTYAILKNMNAFLSERQVPLVIASVDEDEALKGLCQELSIPFVSLANPYQWQSFGQHWTADGHRFVSDKLKVFAFPFKGTYLR